MIARPHRIFYVVFILLIGCLQPAFAASPIEYSITLANPQQHLVQVTIEIPSGKKDRELQLPVWNALYQVRDFSQYMNRIHAADLSGRPLLVSEVNKSRWKIYGAENGARVTYELFADNPGPYGAQLNPNHAFFNLAEILCYLEGERGNPAEVEFHNIPARWKIATPLVQQRNIFLASNYDQMVDSPVEIAAFDEADFAANGATYRVIVDANESAAVLSKIVPVIRRIVTAETGWMNDRPFQTYTFIYHFSDSPGDGGMEHSYAAAITLPAQYLSEDFDRFESITAHEFFHLWNVKRVRPQSLEPVDYTKENYTPVLWFSEGVDSTVSGYTQLRAGLLDERGYLKHLSEQITELEDRPAHLTQSAEQSSIDAWLEKYSYYNLPGRSISYYNKGELLGVLLDLKMREATDGRISLQELFRWLNEHYAKQGKFFPDSDGVRDAAQKLTHANFQEFFRKYVSGVDEIPWDSFFRLVGLHVTRAEVTVADPGFKASRIFDQPLTVLQVEGGSDAWRAGLRAGDAIVELNGRQANRDIESELSGLLPGASLHLRIRRDGVEQELHWTLSGGKRAVFRLQDLSEVTPLQKSRRAAWLFGATAELPAQ
jgi:predicted metalloprotease with PDZ domain